MTFCVSVSQYALNPPSTRLLSISPYVQETSSSGSIALGLDALGHDALGHELICVHAGRGRPDFNGFLIINLPADQHCTFYCCRGTRYHCE